MHFFEYGARETDYLKGRDPLLGRYIEQIGPLKRKVNPDLFAALANSIVGQQISTKAQVTIWGRMGERLGGITPGSIGSHSCEAIQACGVSMRKAQYIRDAALAVLEGEVDLHSLGELSDREVAEHLSHLRGVGKWTAEMLMIFSMQRPDILSYDDLAIQRGLRMVYRHRRITRELFEKYRRRYSPHASVASLYLWEISSGAWGLTDPGTNSGKK